MTLLIGDVHGKFGRYEKIIEKCEGSIQLGDMGVGFTNTYGEARANPPHAKMVKGDHRFIRGNHDNPFVCRGHSQCIPDGAIHKGTMFIGGALSIDRHLRTEGVSWWRDEEQSQADFHWHIAEYAERKPDVMITHDCPESISYYLLVAANWRKIDDPSITRQAFETMLHYHRPKLWVFAHWHFSFDQVIEGTRFICLNELETMELDIG
jgi:hypothetical protein